MIQIRTAQSFDIDKILEIQRECNLSNWTRSDYQKEVTKPDSLILVALINNILIGYLSARFVRADSENLLSSKRKKFLEGDIINIGVLEKYQNRGAGSKLLKEFIKQAAKVTEDSIWLEVREQNVNAINFYEKNGFIKIQIRKNFYTNPVENAIVMKFDISNKIKLEIT